MMVQQVKVLVTQAWQPDFDTKTYIKLERESNQPCPLTFAHALLYSPSLQQRNAYTYKNKWLNSNFNNYKEEDIPYDMYEGWLQSLKHYTIRCTLISAV